MVDKKEKTNSILVIDDEESLRHTFRFFLTREGYDPVMTAANFEEAVSFVSNQSFDLIISDIVLEGASGIDFLKRLRELNIDCPVIMITGYPNVDTAAEAVRLGAFDYISKPVEKELLLRTVRLAMQQRRLEREKKRAEEEREQYRAFLDKIFKSVADSIITVDSNLNISKMNTAATLLFKELQPGVKEGANLSVACTGKEFSSLKSDLLHVLKTGRDIEEHRIECTSPTEQTKVLSVCTSPLENGRGGFTGAVMVLRDMSTVRQQAGTRDRFHKFIGASNAMQMVYTNIEHVGRVDTSILITGESGTGKELAAEALHNESLRKSRPLVKVDCTAIPDGLLESELFGHKKGSFTGAEQDRMGRILQADGGTLFLDEIGDISTMTQLRLLRFLQEKTFYPVGHDTPLQVDVRVIAATNVDLKEKVRGGGFREDLYFRLRVIDVILPSLREREDDAILLAEHFIKKFSAKLNKQVSGISDKVVAILKEYSWPGNVRELEHLIERATVLCTGNTISTEHLPSDLLSSHFNRDASEYCLKPEKKETPLETFFRTETREEISMAERIINTLRKSGGNKAKAARLLGIDRTTLYRKIRELNIDLSIISLE